MTDVPRIKIEKPKSWSEFYLGFPAPPARYGVNWFDVTQSMTDELASIIETARNERPIQRFFEKYPQLLSHLLGAGHARWVIPEQWLGNRYKIDFAMCEKDSAGGHWTLVELENPTYHVLRSRGDQPTEHFTHAQQQILD